MGKYRKQSISSLPMYMILRVVIWLIALAISVLIAVQPVARNQAFNHALKSIMHQSVDYNRALRTLEPIALYDFRVNLQIGLFALHIDNPPKIQYNMNHELDCTSAIVDWLIMVAPQRSDLASLAAKYCPHEGGIWKWLGDLANTSGDLNLASQYYAESVRINPLDGLSWCRLGRVNEQIGQHEVALDAYWQCCQNGDPGPHGCLGAGRVSEKLGDISSAIQYYRRSNWQPAQQRADELEASR